MSDSPKLLLDWLAFAAWLLERTAGWPKRLRYSLTARVENNLLAVLEALTNAQYAERPSTHLEAASLALDRLRILLRLAHQIRAIDNRAYERCAERITVAGRMLGGWLRHSAEREAQP